MKITVTRNVALPRGLYRNAARIARAEGITVDAVVAKYFKAGVNAAGYRIVRLPFKGRLVLDEVK